MHSFSLFDRVFSKRASRPALGLLAALGLSSSASAAAIVLNASDAAGTSSFAAGTNWAGGAAPSAGNTYSVNVNQRRLRTPADGNSYTFAGDSLTIANTYNTAIVESASSDDLFGFSYKGTGSTGILTINNLILAGGSFNHLSGAADVCRIAGNLSITAPSVIRAKQGSFVISSVVSGNADLYIGGTDGLLDSRSVTFSGTNTFSGNIITKAASSTFILADTGTLSFVIGAAGVNNKISGPGTVKLNGHFALNLAGASTTIGDSWTLVDVSTVVETFGTTFAINGFTESNNVWIGQLNGHYYQFTEATGVLTVIDTPPAFPNPTITAAPRSNTVLVGSTVNLSVTATGVGSLTYQWYKDSSPLSGQTSATLSLTNVQTTATGTYSVTVTDHAAESATPSQPATTSSASATLTVIAASDATVAYYRFEDGSDTAGLSSATDSAAGATTLTASGSLTYSATVPYGKVPGTSANNNLSAAFPASGNNGLVAPTSGALADTVFTSFTIEGFVRHSSLSGFQTYVGRDDAGTPGQGTGPQSLLYLQKNNGNLFRIELIDKSNVNLQVNSSTSAAVDTWYHIAAVGDAGAGTLKLYLNGTEIGTTNGFTGLFVPTSGSDAPWTLGRGDYNNADVDFLRGFLDEVRISRVALAPSQFLNSNGTTTFTNPSITTAPISQTVLVGGSASFTVAATGSGLTYQWYKDNSPLSGQTSATLSLTGVAATADGTYSVVVTDPAGASIGVTLSSTASAVLRVVDAPAASRAISLDFVGAATTGSWSSSISTMASADSAGFVPVVNWNNSAAVTAIFSQTTPLALIENTGTSSPATATWDSANTWAARGTTGEPATKTGEFRLLHGYIETRATTGASVTVSNIPYASYDVYVYVAGGTSGTIGKAAINRDGSPVYYYRVSQHDAYTSTTAPTTMIGLSTDATTAASAPTATFVRFAGVTGSDLTVTTTDNTLNANAGGIAAIEIVDRTPAGTPYPPTVTSAPASLLKAGGSSATFTVAATSNNSGGVISYQWQKDGVNIGGQTSATLSLSSLTGSASGSYSVIVTDTSSLGASTATKSASLIVVDASRPLLINGDLNAAASPTFVGNGILRTTGLNHTGSELGQGTTVWNGVLGAAGTATRSLTKDYAGLTLAGVSFTYTGAEGVEDNTTAGFVSSNVLPLVRDYLYTDNQSTPLTGTITGLDAFVGQQVTLVVYAYGKLSKAFDEATANDTATVTLASASNYLGTAPQATSTWHTAFASEQAGRDLAINNLDYTGGVSSAYVSFTGVVAPGGTVSWSLGPDSDAGRIPLVGFQLLISGTSLAPAVPTGLAAVAGNSQVSLTWNASSGANTYTIGRSTTSGGPYTTISAGAVATTSYTDTTAVNGTTYYYVVAAATTSPAAQSPYSAQVSATPVSATALQTWRQTYFSTTANSGSAANSADPDGDGLVNLLEYALGTVPTAANTSPVVLGQSGGALTLTFTPKVDANLSYVVEASNDLAGTWTVVQNYGSFSSAAPVTYTDSVVLSSSNAKRFLRLKVTSTE